MSSGECGGDKLRDGCGSSNLIGKEREAVDLVGEHDVRDVPVAARLQHAHQADRLLHVHIAVRVALRTKKKKKKKKKKKNTPGKDEKEKRKMRKRE